MKGNDLIHFPIPSHFPISLTEFLGARKFPKRFIGPHMAGAIGFEPTQVGFGDRPLPVCMLHTSGRAPTDYSPRRSGERLRTGFEPDLLVNSQALFPIELVCMPSPSGRSEISTNPLSINYQLSTNLISAQV